MKILYIGGTGEISYACVAAGAALGQEITVFNRGRNDEPLPPGVKMIRGELNDATYRALGEGHFDVVCQFLAYAPEQIERDLAVFGGKISQYLFISTASAYQKPPRDWRITEQTPLVNSFWPYSQTKADMEAMLFGWHEAGKLPVTVVRPSHTYRRKFPGTFISGDDHVWRMTHGKPVIIHGDGTSLWTHTHASDFAKPFVRLLGNAKALGRAFHITRPDATTWNAIFQTIGRVLGVEPKFVYVPTATLVKYNPEWVGPLLGDKAWPVQFDLTNLMAVVGEFTCDTSMDESLGSVVPHYRRRAETFVPDEKLHALIDRIAGEQAALGV
ncbi:MAG: putative mRNA-binding protein [Phycisphaerales bacterium]|nr:putative mRNA-binding protein [Phycisphaerales bacterium]